jgi:hypothetical protein
MIRPIILGVARVQISHKYEPKHVLNKKSNITEVIGVPVSTTVVVETDTETQTGKAVCSKKDHFTFEEGRKKALKKALGQMASLTKEERRRIWEEYSKLKPGGRW